MFEIIFGLVFILVAALSFIVCLIVSSIVHTVMVGIVGLIFLLCFGIPGYLVFSMGMRKRKIDKETNLYGREYVGKIIDYRDSNSYVNGVPILIVGVAVFDGSQVKVYYEDTGSTKESKYPMFSYIRVKLYNGDINVYPESVGAIPGYDEERAIEEFHAALEARAVPIDVPYVPGTYKKKTEAVERTSDDTIIIDGVEYKKTNM